MELLKELFIKFEKNYENNCGMIYMILSTIFFFISNLLNKFSIFVPI